MHPDPSQIRRLNDLSVMVVEDNATSRQLMERLLAALGYGTVTVATGGDEALELMARAPTMPDLILCDWQMPGTNGLALLNEIRSRNEGVVFVMVTATNSMEAALLAKAHGVDGYLLKPVNKANLQAAIETAVKRARKINP